LLATLLIGLVLTAWLLAALLLLILFVLVWIVHELFSSFDSLNRIQPLASRSILPVTGHIPAYNDRSWKPGCGS